MGAWSDRSRVRLHVGEHPRESALGLLAASRETSSKAIAANCLDPSTGADGIILNPSVKNP